MKESTKGYWRKVQQAQKSISIAKKKEREKEIGTLVMKLKALLATQSEVRNSLNVARFKAHAAEVESVLEELRLLGVKVGKPKVVKVEVDN